MKLIKPGVPDKLLWMIEPSDLSAISSGGDIAPFQTINELKGYGGMSDKDMAMVEDTGQIYRYDEQSSSTSDNKSIILPNSGVGRWFKVSNMLIDDLNESVNTTYSSEKIAEYVNYSFKGKIIRVNSNDGFLASNGANGFDKPYINISEAMDAIDSDISSRILGSETRSDCKYIVELSPGVYNEDINIPACSAIQFNMMGSILNGNITRVATQNDFGSSYYTKLIFNGGSGIRAEKGHQSVIAGDIIMYTNEGSNYLYYTAFSGVELDCNITADTGVAVILFDKTSHYNSSKSITGNGAILLEIINRSRVKAHMVGDVSCYNCFDSEINYMNVSPSTPSKFYNTVFDGTFNITGPVTISMDATSSKSFLSQSPTLTDVTIELLEGTDNISNDSEVDGETLTDALNDLCPKSGTLRPDTSGIKVGTSFFDETINQEIWWNGSSWVRSKEIYNTDLQYPNGICEISSKTPGIGNKPKDVAVEGKYAYMLQHENPGFMVIYDISDVNNPVVVNAISINNGPNSIEVKNNIAYIGCNTGRFYIVDANDKDNLVILSNNDYGGQKFDIAVSDNIVALADATGGGLHILDVTDLENPSIAYNSSFSAGGVDIYSDYAFVTDYSNSKVNVYDISNLSSISLVNSHSVGGMVVNISVSKGIVFVGEYSSPNLYVVDMTDVMSPVDIGTYSVSSQLTFEGSSLIVKDNLYIFTTDGKVSVYDISNDYEPVLLMDYDFGGYINGGQIDSRGYIIVPNNSSNCLTILSSVKRNLLVGDIVVGRLNGISEIKFKNNMVQTNIGGDTSSRPSEPYEYQQYFDSDLSKPIWWNGTDWVDSTGTIV